MALVVLGLAMPWRRAAAQAVVVAPDTTTATPRTPADSAFAFTIRNMMRGPEVYGREPEDVRWTPDGRWIYFRWNRPGTAWDEPPRPFRVRATPGSAPEEVSPAQMDTAGPLLAAAAQASDRPVRAVAYEGDLYLVNVRAGSARRLTRTEAREGEPALSPDARTVYFARDSNAYALDLASGLTRQLTDIRTGPAPEQDSAATGQRGYLERQQRELFDAVRDRIRRDSLQRLEGARHDSLGLLPIYLRKNERVAELSVAPSGRAVLIRTMVPNTKERRVEIPQYVTRSGYTESLRGRTKVGDALDGGRIGIVALPGSTVRWLRVAPADTVRPPADIAVLGWNPTGTAAAIFALTGDFKTRYIQVVSADSLGAPAGPRSDSSDSLAARARTPGVRTVDILRDSAWVDGPCYACGGWTRDGSRIWFVSEASGYAHLYSVRPDGSDRRQLTSGKWEVLEAGLSNDGRSFYMMTSESSPYERQLWRMPVDGGARTRITTRPGGHDATLSSDERRIADVYSEPNRPPEIYLMENRAGAPMSRLTTSPTAAWLAFPWVRPEIVTYPASDGARVPARLFRPRMVGAPPNGAAVIFVHGAGYLHEVVNYWSPYPREYMFNQYLASKGYVVLDPDYRGSAGYGRDWRTAIYRYMGGRDLQDVVDGSRYLQSTFGVNAERVGLYGGSYGGFMTLMALFTEPESFGAGAALRSVTDWSHYNDGYTARILNRPQDDSLSYRRSSPIYFASGLEDPLLMAHGMVDTNVHFQDIVRLTQRLIELGKTDWQLAVYPVESHGFVRPSSWTDEYRRIFDLFERTIRQPLESAPAGKSPR